jgi:hypothetical protein
MTWFEVLKYQGWRDVKPQLIENQETKEATIDWIKRNRSITLNGHERINKQIQKLMHINKSAIKENVEFDGEWFLLKPLELNVEHPIVTTSYPRYHPQKIVDDVRQQIERHQKTTIELIKWLGSDNNKFRILRGDLV